MHAMHFVCRMSWAMRMWEERQAASEDWADEYDTTVVVATGVTKAEYDRFVKHYTGKIR